MTHPTTFPPGPATNWLTPLTLSKTLLPFLQNNAQQYGDITSFKLLGRRVFQLNHPDAIQAVLVKNAEHFHKSPNLKRATREAIGNGLLTSDGALHKRQRQLVQPAFHSQRISAYAATMVQYTEELLQHWQSGAHYDLLHEMNKLTMRIVTKTLFDVDIIDQADELGAAITLGIETANERILRPLPLFLLLPTPRNRERKAAGELLHRTIMRIIAERRAQADDRGDLLSMLLEAQDHEGQMSDQQVHDEVMTLFIAGHETTANALTWALYLLGQHPDALRQVQTELAQQLGGHKPTMADWHRLPYLNQVVHEALRLYPPAWIVTRQAMQTVEIGGYTIPEKSMVLMSQYVVQHDARWFPEPNRFIPERFSAGWEQQLPKYAYFPFGGGPRVCIGNQFAMLELILVLATVLQSTTLMLVEGQQIAAKPVVTLRPDPTVWVRVAQPERQPA